MLTLNHADRIIDGAIAKARAESFERLCIVVLDAGAHVIALKREDGAGFFRSAVATAKATGALGLGFDSREIAKRAGAAPVFYGALASITGGMIAPSPGAVLIRAADGTVLGAVGASGDTGDNDEICVKAGLAAAGLDNPRM
ncbi:MAG: heme-binding protein [Gammaproteobacteria bacterium]|nr:heme-binding protein [Gammaproteobacteria bacterium]